MVCQFLAGVVLASPGGCRTSSSLYGPSGLFSIPVANVIPEGTFLMGIDFSSGGEKKLGNQGVFFTHLNLGFFPKVELSFRVALAKDVFPLNVPSSGRGSDRMMSVQYKLAEEGGHIPSVVIGLQDIFTGGRFYLWMPPRRSSALFASRYIVASKTFRSKHGTVRFHLGVGTGRLSGIFGGVEKSVGTRCVLTIEHDTSRIIMGLKYELSRQARLKFGWGGEALLLGLRFFGPG